MLVGSAGLIVACSTVTTGIPAAAVPPREGPTPAMVATQTANLALLESPHPAVPTSIATKGSLHPTSPVESQPTPIAPPAPAEIAKEVADAWLAVQTEWRTLLPGGWPLPTAWNGDGLYHPRRVKNLSPDRAAVPSTGQCRSWKPEVGECETPPIMNSPRFISIAQRP